MNITEAIKDKVRFAWQLPPADAVIRLPDVMALLELLKDKELVEENKDLPAEP